LQQRPIAKVSQGRQQRPKARVSPGRQQHPKDRVVCAILGE